MARRLLVDGIGLHVEDEGTGPAVLLLHGWPDSSWLWRHQIPALTTAGFRTVAPDLRGFGSSDRPADPTAYRLSTLRSDAVAVLDQLGIERTHVVGHDWGAALAWELAIHHPDRIDRLVVIAAPHPAVPAGIDQRERYWFHLLFQFEGTAERLLTHDDWALFHALTRRGGDVARHVADLSRPDALTASLNLYRANAAPGPEGAGCKGEVAAPTMVVWPERDPFVVGRRLQASTSFVRAPFELVRLRGAGHWAPVEVPREVNELVLRWLRSP